MAYHNGHRYEFKLPKGECSLIKTSDMEILAEAFDGLDDEQWMGLIRVKDRRGLEVPPNRLMTLVKLTDLTLNILTYSRR